MSRKPKRLQFLSVATVGGADGNSESKDSSPTAARSFSRETKQESPSTKPTLIRSGSHHERPSDIETGHQEPKVTKRVQDIVYHQPRKPSPLANSSVSPISTIISIECNLDNSDETQNLDGLYHLSDHGLQKSTRKGNLIPTTWHRERSHTSVNTATTIIGSIRGKETTIIGSIHGKETAFKVVPQPKQHSPSGPIELSLPLPKVPPQLECTSIARGKGERLWRLFHGMREYLTPPTLGLLLGLFVALTPLRCLFIQTSTTPVSSDELPPLSFILEITLMLGACCVPLGLTVLGASVSRLKPGRMRPLVPALALLSLSKMALCPLIGIYIVQGVLVRHYGLLDKNNHMLQFTLMLMSGSPTSITCFVLALVWDRRTKNAGSEMAALIAVCGGDYVSDGAECVYDVFLVL